MSEVFRYQGSVVGSVDERQELTVFEWAQVPFQVFSTSETIAYGMSHGLKDKLEESRVDVVETQDGTLLHLDEITNCETVYPTHSVFGDNPPSEPQKIVRVERVDDRGTQASLKSFESNNI